ncbi:putative disease resistance protein RGA3 isoform X2 [Carex rostrata]
MILWEKALEFLVSTIGQSVVDTWRSSNDVDSYFSELRDALPKAQRLIERSECWRLPMYDPIDKLLKQLKDSMYEAESIVDELEYERLKNKVEKSSGIRKILKNWMKDFPTKVKGVHDRLNKFYDEMKEVCDRHGIPENPNQFSQTARPKTGTLDLEISNVRGRDKEFDEVVRLMGVVPSSGSCKRKKGKRVSMHNSDIGESRSRMDKKGNVSVLSIVGMGGVGKTTLAQMVCNDKSSVKKYFDLIMWVCVSDNFDSVRLTKEMIESATKKECNLTNFNEMQLVLEEALKSKKFLLVLDDVWSKDWQRVLAPMKEASEGSVVLVTTRSPECVEISGSSIGSRGVINLEGLEELIYWEFFKSCAFNSVAESTTINPELEVIGKEICKRLKGSPLAAKTIGGLLRTNLNVGHWMRIKDSKMWELQKGEHDILPVLQLSYQYLPTDLKKCFSFCSLYPKDFKFTQSELTQFWIMQGFIGPLDNEKELRTLANGYFSDLARRAFFQRLGDENDRYVIHDLMHDVCQSITKDECFCLENGHSEVSLDIRHVSVFQKILKLEEQKELCKYEKLLSLKVGPTSSCGYKIIEAWCNVLPNIRSLSLARCKIKKLPDNIGNLKHLRFLDISGTNIEILPESICNLYNLQYLNMMDCKKIELFPKGFDNLVNLECFENIVKAMQSNSLMVCLQGNKKIEILKNFCKFNGSLHVKGLEYVPSKEAAQEAQLNNKPFINRLVLEWSFSGNSGNEDHDHEVLDGLCPHDNLKELKISGYGGRNLSPSWLKEEFLPNLTEVEFDLCSKVSTISHLPRFITKLVIRECHQLFHLQNLLEPNHLPALKHIEVRACENLDSLSVELFGGFKLLEQLIIVLCPKIRSPNAMVLPPSVKGLELSSCGDLEKSIPSCLQNLTSLETLRIYDCQHLVSIPAEVTSNLKSLLKLYLWSCPNLQSLGGLQFLASLQELGLFRCDKLQSVGGLQFLASLREVHIHNCLKLDETRGQNINGKLPSELLGDTIIRKRRARKSAAKDRIGS